MEEKLEHCVHAVWMILSYLLAPRDELGRRAGFKDRHRIAELESIQTPL